MRIIILNCVENKKTAINPHVGFILEKKAVQLDDFIFITAYNNVV